MSTPIQIPPGTNGPAGRAAVGAPFSEPKVPGTGDNAPATVWQQPRVPTAQVVHELRIASPHPESGYATDAHGAPPVVTVGFIDNASPAGAGVPLPPGDPFALTDRSPRNPDRSTPVRPPGASLPGGPPSPRAAGAQGAGHRS